MERYQFRNAALAALVAWPIAATAQAPQAACLPGTTASPGTMTEMGFPCPEGAGPGAPAGSVSALPTTAETGGVVGPAWSRQPAGAAGVPADSRMTGAAETSDATRPSGTAEKPEAGSDR